MNACLGAEDILGRRLLLVQKKSIIFAAATGNLKKIVLDVNENTLDGSEKVISNTSCTPNCLATIVKMLGNNFGIECGFVTMIHAYTSDQRLQDAPQKDLRCARSAGLPIIHTNTSGSKTLGLVIPSVQRKLNDLS